MRPSCGVGANLGATVPVFAQPYPVASMAMADGVTDALGQGEAVILQSNGMLAVGQSMPHACVQALFLEETAELQPLALGAGLTQKFYIPEGAARRHGDDRVHEPVRAWSIAWSIM
ncbi:MAG: class II aldolase/adducin family protein, partial [Xanthobacteraceae bacterium]